MNDGCTTASCTNGDQKPCYDGPEFTLGVGVCSGGVATCDDTGKFGACVGEVVPTNEDDCKTDADENCDGYMNEGCSTIPGDCTPGIQSACYDADYQLLGVGTCSAGLSVCGQDKTWSACAGAVYPVTEICGDGKDNDCDGEADELVECPPAKP